MTEVTQPTPEEIARTKAARSYVHANVCPPPNNRHTDQCMACPTWSGTLLALRLLDQRPRDAKGARRALHDVVCRSGCGPDDDHADKTQARTVAALRKFRAAENVADDHAARSEPAPCGHGDIVRGCGGCDPGAIEFVVTDAGILRRYDPARDMA